MRFLKTKIHLKMVLRIAQTDALHLRSVSHLQQSVSLQ